MKSWEGNVFTAICLSVILPRGRDPHLKIPHGAWNLPHPFPFPVDTRHRTYRLPSPWISDIPGYLPPLLDTRHGTYPLSAGFQIWDLPPCYWHLVVITGNLFKLVHLRTYPTPQYWHQVVAIETHTIGKQAVHILLECFLVTIVFTCHKFTYAQSTVQFHVIVPCVM